jgi:hypothetical protein
LEQRQEHGLRNRAKFVQRVLCFLDLRVNAINLRHIAKRKR